MDFTLQRHPAIPPCPNPVLVCILDGWGENLLDEYNAIHVAKTPVTDGLKTVPERWRTVRAHGTAVGLPSDADMGNSEVGHNALGSGQLIDQGARLVDNALADGSAFTGEGWGYIKEAFAEHTVHFIGLLSDGGVHSRLDQLVGFLKGAQRDGAKRIRIHILTDGRDVPDGTSKKYVADLEEELAALDGVDAKIASGGGRMYVTMDRYEADWKIVERGWKAHVLGEAEQKFTSAGEAVTRLRGPDDKVSDQWLPPFVIVDDAGQPVGTVEDGDAVVLFNFRADRMVEISKAFEYEDFNAFERTRWPRTKFVGMMTYDGDLKLPANFLVPPPAINGVSGEFLVKNGLRTFACSETQKFGHVTFFWNGNRSGYFDEELETYVEIPSDNVPFNQIPEMKAREITAAGKEALQSRRYDMVRINFANPDMVGHTGDLEACATACSLVDACVKELLDTVDALGGRWLLTADHGNADDMAPVPVAIGGKGLPDSVGFRTNMPNAGLANITATIINLLGFQAPKHMEPSLI